MSDLAVGEMLQSDLPRLDKVLVILDSKDVPMKVSEIKEFAIAQGFRGIRTWNVSAVLGRSKGRAILLPSGWSLSASGKTYLAEQGLRVNQSSSQALVSDLRNHLAQIESDTTRAFVAEAIGCFEQGFFRAAIVMSWIAAMDVLHAYVADNKLVEFNAEARRVNTRWRDAVGTDGLTKMGEEDFLNRIAAIGVIGRNQKEELLKCLKLRNGCGHPNSLKVGRNTVSAHIEMLILNVFERFRTPDI